MLSSAFSRACLASILLACGSGSAGAWWDRCDCPPYAYGYGPPPVYVYGPRSAPVWTPAGWTYPAIYYWVPTPPPYASYRYPGYYPDYRYRHRRPRAVW